MKCALRFYCCIAALALALPGCSAHPLPENFPLNLPRTSTLDIVRKVRCEAKAGLDRFKNSKRKDQIMEATSIGFDFSFVMTENNDLADGELDFVGRPDNPNSKRSVTVKLTGKAMKERKNTRTFRIIEDLADIAKADCSGEALRANLAYPISGSLHIDDIVYTYIRLERMSNLEDPKDDLGGVAEDKSRKGVFSEQIEFRTALKLGATPTLTISAEVGSFRLTNATVGSQLRRKDSHDVIIAFAQDVDFHKNEVAQRKSFLKGASGAEGRVADDRFIPDKRFVIDPRYETALVQVDARRSRPGCVRAVALAQPQGRRARKRKVPGRAVADVLAPPERNPPG